MREQLRTKTLILLLCKMLYSDRFLPHTMSTATVKLLNSDPALDYYEGESNDYE